MALLLAMYQKMRLTREKNQVALDLIKVTSKYDRVKKNIERIQKLFTNRKAKLESQAKLMQNQSQSIFRQMSGLNISSSAYLDPYQMGGTNAFVNQRLQGYLSSGIPMTYDATTGKLVQNSNGGNTAFTNQQAAMALYQSGKINNVYRHYTDEAKTTVDEDGFVYYKDASGAEQSVPIGDYYMLQAAISQSQSDYTSANQWLNQATTCSQTNISIWLENETEKLEAEQDEALEPLSCKETMWELEKAQLEQRAKEIEAQLESYTQLADNEAKNMAPKFGV